MEIVDYNKMKDCFCFLQSLGGIAMLDSQGHSIMGSGTQKAFYQGTIHKINAYEALFEGKNALLDYKVVVAPMGIDEILLFENREKIADFLEKGGILLSFTQNYQEWLPGNSLYIASKTPIRIREVKTCGHFITHGVKEYDINYRRGVKGFFNRGYFIPPKNACVFLKDSDEQCVAYIDKQTTKGTIVCTAGADLISYGLYESSTAKRMGLNLMLWIEKTIKESA